VRQDEKARSGGPSFVFFERSLAALSVHVHVNGTERWSIVDARAKVPAK
jgi:hypothetical protein